MAFCRFVDIPGSSNGNGSSNGITGHPCYEPFPPDTVGPYICTLPDGTDVWCDVYGVPLPPYTNGNGNGGGSNGNGWGSDWFGLLKPFLTAIGPGVLFPWITTEEQREYIEEETGIEIPGPFESFTGSFQDIWDKYKWFILAGGIGLGVLLLVRRR